MGEAYIAHHSGGGGDDENRGQGHTGERKTRPDKNEKAMQGKSKQVKANQKKKDGEMGRRRR